MTGLAGIWLLRGKLYCRAALARRGACLLRALVAPPAATRRGRARVGGCLASGTARAL